ncbi:MAG TPA: hypothetical protein VGI43_09830 [Mucilaginibacter sp.]|jgi:hypothetical protein
MVYKQVLIPDKNNHTVEMPEQFFGKKIEVIVIELGDSADDTNPSLPVGKKVSVSELFENFGSAPDFPSIDKIRDKAWPTKW